MYVLLNQKGQPVVTANGKVIVSGNIPDRCGSKTWEVIMQIESGAIDPDYEDVLCEMYAGIMVASGASYVIDVLEIPVQNNCYVWNGLTGSYIPDTTDYRSPGSGPFTIVYSWSAAGTFFPEPINEIATWQAKVRVRITFDQFYSCSEIGSVLSLDYSGVTQKFPNAKVQYSYKPITTGDDNGENNEI